MSLQAASNPLAGRFYLVGPRIKIPSKRVDTTPTTTRYIL